MNLGRGFTVPKEKKVTQNGDDWIPATPGNPVLQRSNNPQPEMVDNERQNLLGIYTGLLQNVGPIGPNRIFGAKDGLQNRRQNSNQNSLQQSIEDFNTLQQKNRNLNQKAQNLGEVVPPQKVNSLAELMGMTSDRWAPPSPKLHANREYGGYNLHETPNDRLSMPNYNQNLPPRLEAREPSIATRLVPMGPGTPDQQKQSSTDHIIQESNLLTDKTSTSAKHAAVSTSPKENRGIDLNKTPEQKPTKRRKLRPKVVVEGKKPKRTPKNNTPPVKRKNAVKTSTTPLTDVESNVGPTANSCKRRLNFDLDNQAQNNEGSKFKFNLNLESRNGECSTELNSQSINKKVPSKETESLPVATKAFPTSSKTRTLNVIARSLSVKDAHRTVVQANTSEPNLDCRRESTVRILPQVLENLVDITEKQDIKHPHTITLMGSQVWLHEISGTGHCNKDGSNLWKNGAATCKKMNSENIFHGNSSSMVSGITTVEGRRNKNFPVQCSIMHQIGGLTNSDSGGQSIISRNLNDKSSCIQKNDNTNSPDSAAIKPRKKAPVKHKFLQQGYNNSRSHGSQEEKRNLFSIDDITNFMKDLHINNNGKEIVLKADSALVPYRGEGAIVPYNELDFVRKRQARPRVDLDPETNRLWNLLMGKEGSESAKTMDSDKQKWWEEERKVFRGRVDSFIARMHLVQGDRHFSKWKGSVVDSVIGVFLTQNVSDHLSSSAFMSLAAKFPPKQTTATQSCCGNGVSPSVKHHEVRITYPDGTSYDHKVVKESAGHRSENRTILIKDYTRRIEEDIISSQSSSESCVFQASEDHRFRTGSNAEAENGWDFSKNLGYLSVSKQAERIAALQQYQFQLMGSSCPKIPLIGHQKLENPAYRQNPFVLEVPNHQNMSVGLEKGEEDVLAYSGKEHISSLSSTDFGITNGRDLEHRHEKIGQIDARNSFTETRKPKFQPSVLDHAILNKNGSQNMYGQHLIKQRQEKQETFQQESVFATGQKIPTKALGEQQSYHCKHAGDKTAVLTETEQVHSSSKISTTPATRKRKAEKEKTETVNWDTLRKQVQSKAGPRGRSREATDSIDYEALRNADVREISDTIKERGMNNMLAERIKDFLNRVVHDHQRVDLEWLRDVQPDKVKDYLLSIRGLGLKSVECVRLLTLHHLAFPVDINVGRIAVRLGWVPLQPLPESLQLHLLELYPVLESIQKYLWPRLCKLDQQTLYELHYQMITFGKVFCTKREPNCNACPLRGECRHFASAFASARLALPGPEARDIVSSTAPFTANKSSGVIINPMLLSLSEDNVERGLEFKRNSEPLIEEPTTPESPIEVSERDIEDAFYEDPDEIPLIKLNVEEFTTNLQSFMQEQMEMEEGDMSKALVTLSPEFASVPIPKLKHVSRLRTAHQMDRREPDDPSPYLLAIWTPGETADSVQPPESKCSSQGGGLCNKKTCFACNSTREAQRQTVRGTILIPCRTAMRGSFPLNGTYFQVNEVFADHESSLSPIDVPRSLIWNLPRRTVFFGTSVSTIFKGMITEDIQYCFWKGFVCVRGFDQKTRAPRPLKARLHLPASKMNGKEKRVKIN